MSVFNLFTSNLLIAEICSRSGHLSPPPPSSLAYDLKNGNYYTPWQVSAPPISKSSASLLDRCQIDVTPSLTNGVMFSFYNHISVFVDPFGCCFRFCHLGFDKESISDGCRNESAQYLWWV